MERLSDLQRLFDLLRFRADLLHCPDILEAAQRAKKDIRAAFLEAYNVSAHELACDLSDLPLPEKARTRVALLRQEINELAKR